MSEAGNPSTPVNKPILIPPHCTQTNTQQSPRLCSCEGGASSQSIIQKHEPQIYFLQDKYQMFNFNLQLILIICKIICLSSLYSQLL